ncbi:MAG TPA: hypothetical protein PK664_06525 [Paludibacteraceae bacterium]|jgi:hypothetical protein|nr:hypothetical protein [Paludibacteraceae bacterium]HPS11010.1 hypothetical protein [Paludibacteraceae bacterium]
MQFPLNFTFKITTISNDFRVNDATGAEVAFVRQKLFKLKEEVQVFNDESRSQLNFTVKANKWLDFSAAYVFYDNQQRELGRIVRRGWKSLWKSSYDIYDENQKQDFSVNEENPLIKVFDGLFGDIPILGMFTGYFFNPTYLVTRPDGTAIARLSKEKSFFGRRFSVDKLAEFESGEENRLLLGLMMMILLERQRG